MQMQKKSLLDDKQDKQQTMKDDTMPSTSRLINKASIIKKSDQKDTKYFSDEDSLSSLSEAESDLPSTLISQVYYRIILVS